MRLPTSILLLMALMLVGILGCKPTGSMGGSRDATLGDAQAYLSALEAELKAYPSMTYHASGSGQAGNIKTAESRFSADATELNAGELYDHAERAFMAWGNYKAFSTRGHGGGGNSYELHFGNHKTHAFVDLIAHEKDGKTTVECLVRVVE